MAISSSGVLMDTLRQQSLLSPEQLAQLPHLSIGRCSDARSVAKMLIQRGWLSVYQVNQLLIGNTQDLNIGPYAVIDKLGQGGLSQVYKGRHRETDAIVAIKIIKAEVFANAEGRQQFLQEVDAMARLDHENIVQFCDADQWRDTFYFAMEYVDGTDLGKVIRLCGPLAVHETCDLIRQAALGLQHAYERNLIHRDIKPVNLFLTQTAVQNPAMAMFATKNESPTSESPTVVARSIIKILDWGLASLKKPIGANKELVNESVARSIVGTADYLAPEQARNSCMADIRSDIYSLGCTCYFLLTGQPPFPDGALMQKILQHQQAEPKPLAEFRVDVNPGVEALIKRMMAKAPENRFQTPASVALALSEFTTPPPTQTKSGLLRLQRSKLPTRDDTPLPPPLAGRPVTPRSPDDTECSSLDDSKKTLHH